MKNTSAISLPASIAAYLHKRGTLDRWRINDMPTRTFAGAIVIPSLAEAANLPHTLESLSYNPAELLECFIILVVVNQRLDAADAVIADNRQTLGSLPLWKEHCRLNNLFWVDAASSGNELPAKQGVGLARKIGLDLALTTLDYSVADPLLICLDADTLVQPDYLAALGKHFTGTSAGGVSIPYRHRSAPDAAGQAAIDRYELFLRVYVLGLELAGSPYAFHTVGSAMACRASAYCAAGGMNRRQAGEDFYFLQQIHKVSGVAALSGTVVHPSPRSSQRVPFGTGRSVGDMLADGEQRLLFYQPVVFSIVRAWLACVTGKSDADAVTLLTSAAAISPHLHDFLVQAGFGAAWDSLQKHSREHSRLMAAFHGWFDAFRTMRLIHELTDRAYPRVAPLVAVAPLLEQVGHVCPDTVGGQLELLRQLQGVK